MKIPKRLTRAKPGLASVAPSQGGFRLSEEISSLWLWIVGIVGAVLVVLAILLDLLWNVTNILPSASLNLGVGVMLFSVLFLLQRRIVRRTNVVWISAWEEMAAQTGQNPDALANHFAGPVAVVTDFVSAILDDADYGRAWQLVDANWRLCRAQAWLWNNRSHPLVSPFDRASVARALSEIRPTHELWPSFAATELEQFAEIWSDPDLRTYGAASATRKVPDGEIVLLVDLSEHPDGAMAHAPTPVFGVSFLVHTEDGAWRIANLVGDHLPEPGWPPEWKEGWTYWDRLLLGDE